MIEAIEICRAKNRMLILHNAGQDLDRSSSILLICRLEHSILVANAGCRSTARQVAVECQSQIESDPISRIARYTVGVTV